MIAKCNCQWCGGHIEFDPIEFQHSGDAPGKTFGQNIQCPHCEKDTLIYLDKAEEPMPQNQNNPAPVKKNKPPMQPLVKWFWIFILIFTTLGTIGNWVDSFENPNDFGFIGGFFASLGGSFAFAFFIFIYLLPSYVAHERKKRNFQAILVLNIFAGWTFIGWLGALVWAVTKD